MILKHKFHARGKNPTEAVISPCSTKISQSNSRTIKKLISVHNKGGGGFPPKWKAVCRPGLLLTSAGTSRLLPKCWLKDRHQASVYPFMLGTYFFTVSSLSLSQTPSSLWIYRGGRTSNRVWPRHPVTMETDGAGGFAAHTHAHRNTHTLTHTHGEPLRLQESLQLKANYDN